MRNKKKSYLVEKFVIFRYNFRNMFPQPLPFPASNWHSIYIYIYQRFVTKRECVLFVRTFYMYPWEDFLDKSSIFAGRIMLIY